MEHRSQARLLPWMVAAVAATTPIVLRLANPGELDVGWVRGAAVAGGLALLPALHRRETGWLRTFWPAVAGGAAAAYLPVLLLGWLLLPAPGVYRANAARPGLEILELEPGGERVVFVPGTGRQRYRLDSSWDGTLGSRDEPLDGSLVICTDGCAPWFTLSRRWPGAPELVLVERHPEVRVTLYARVERPAAPP